MLIDLNLYFYYSTFNAGAFIWHTEMFEIEKVNALGYN